MTEQRSFRLPLPPSLNRTYKMGKGNFYKDQKAHKWALDASWLLKGVTPMPSGRYSLSVVLNGLRANSDLDNRIKQLQDVLENNGIIENDKHIDQLFIQRGSSKERCVDVVITLLPNKETK